MRRRQFLGALVGAPIGLGQLRRAAATTGGAVPRARTVVTAPKGVVRTWLGPQLWANRLQDFKVNHGRYECVDGGRLRSVSLLTYSLLPGTGAATLSMVTGTLATGTGFSGFLIGVGAGRLDYRAAALAQAASGTAGGLLCTYESDGRCRIRSHTSETSQLSYPVLATGNRGPSPARSTAERVQLTLNIHTSRTNPGRSHLTLTARRPSDGVLLSQVTLGGVRDAEVTGGALLVSAPTGNSGARYWFNQIEAAGSKVGSHPARAMGPILGVLFSVNGSVLKMTAQLFPIASTEPQDVTLRFRAVGTRRWTTRAPVSVGDGYVALLRVGRWDTTKSWEYQVIYGRGSTLESTYAGTIPKPPRAATPLTIGIVNCTIHSYRPLDASSPHKPKLAGELPQGLYTSRNLYFPYAELTANLARQKPHLLAALGDQFYENRPTAQDKTASPTLDFLYRYYLWLWSFRNLTKRLPCIVMTDDHDVYQGNLWGHEGAASPGGERDGGYVKAASWVNTVQRVQMSHNPDPYDPTPVQQGITVHYGAFTYAGVSFACVEDRKFKYGPSAIGPDGNPAPISTLPMLGSRQEKFLADWAAMHPGQPKVVLSQTTYAVVKTTPDGLKQADPDNNAYVEARDRALQLVKNAKGLMVCGDQHLGMVVRHGLASFTDGPVQFTVPAAGSAWQRWFEPPPLPNAGSTPHTGDFTDGYGNKMRVVASINPKITQKQYVAAYGSNTHNFGDRHLKNEGYGLVRIDRVRGRFVLECWRWDTDPRHAGASQFPGWPRVVPFAGA